MYIISEKKKETIKRYNHSEKHAKCRQRYQQTQKFSIAYKRYQIKPSTKIRHLFTAAKARARNKNLEFSLVLKEIEDIIYQGSCQVTGLPFDLSPGKGPRSPSIDRIDPTKGYIPENCQIVVWIYNAAKNQWSHEDVAMMSRALYQKEKR